MLLSLGNARSKIENPLQDGVYFLVMLLSFENEEARLHLQVLHWGRVPHHVCYLIWNHLATYVVSSKSLVSSKFTLLHYILTIITPSKLLLTPSTISVWSTYKLTSKLFERPLTIKLLCFHIFSLLYKSWTSSPKLSPMISFSC